MNSDGALFVDDGRPDLVFWMRFTSRGYQSGTARAVPLGVEVPDPEDITTDGQRFYVISSFAKEARSRRHVDLVRFTFDPLSQRASKVATARGLAESIEKQLSGIGGTGPLNVEGLVWDPRTRRLLLGLRSPVIDGDAIIVPVRLEPRADDASTIGAVAEAAVRLKLGGDGVRGLGLDLDRPQILVIAGPAGSLDDRPFRLFEWSGANGSPARSVAEFPPSLKAEGVTSIEIGGRSSRLVVFDTGGYLMLPAAARREAGGR